MRMSLSLAAALLFSTILVAPDIAAAAGEENPTPPSQTNQSAPMKKKVKKKTSSAEDFLKGYHAAYALIYDKGDYVGGIEALRALGYDDNADVATLVGYASRKLGRYEQLQVLVRARARRRPGPRGDLVLLRHVAGRAGQRA